MATPHHHSQPASLHILIFLLCLQFLFASDLTSPQLREEMIYTFFSLLSVFPQLFVFIVSSSTCLDLNLKSWGPFTQRNITMTIMIMMWSKACPAPSSCIQAPKCVWWPATSPECFTEGKGKKTKRKENHIFIDLYNSAKNLAEHCYECFCPLRLNFIHISSLIS